MNSIQNAEPDVDITPSVELQLKHVALADNLEDIPLDNNVLENDANGSSKESSTSSGLRNPSPAVDNHKLTNGVCLDHSDVSDTGVHSIWKLLYLIYRSHSF